jgi:hypothetical protein
MRSLLATCFAACVAVVTAVPAYGQIGVTSSTLVERTAEPGENYRGTIIVHNSSDKVQVVSLSLADYAFQADGSTTFNDPGSQERSNSGWIKLAQRAVSVLPHADAAVAYTVTVPMTARDGTYWSVVLVEAVRSSEAALPSGGLAVLTNFRYAVQVVTQIGNTGVHALAFGPPNLRRRTLGVRLIANDVPEAGEAVDDTDYLLSLEISHAGTRACRPLLRLEVYGTDGTLVHDASAQRGLLYPGTSINQVFELGSLSPGDYTFLLMADVGEDKVQGTKFPVRIR